MIYVMSDIHGCYDKYKLMMDKIKFKEEDTLYILGDVVDRGPQGMKVLLDIADKENVILLKGNHDLQAGILLSNLSMPDSDICSKELVDLYGIWLSDGGESTLKEYLELSDEERVTVINVIARAKLSMEIEVAGCRYHLSHTIPEIERVGDFATWTEEDFVMGEPDYDKTYFKDMHMITGHSLTCLIDKHYTGRIWCKNNHIAIDCGAVYGMRLGCLCLDTMEEYYT